MTAIGAMKENRFAVGSRIAVNSFDRWVKEKLTGLNTHVQCIHTKFMLINPLGDDPIVITGSANFSEDSTKANDENMLVIRGNTRVADIYVGETCGRGTTTPSRVGVEQADPDDTAFRHLDLTDGWTAETSATPTAAASASISPANSVSVTVTETSPPTLARRSWQPPRTLTLEKRPSRRLVRHKSKPEWGIGRVTGPDRGRQGAGEVQRPGRRRPAHRRRRRAAPGRRNRRHLDRAHRDAAHRRGWPRALIDLLGGGQ